MQDAGRLRAIAKEIRELSEFTSAADANQYFLRISEGGKLVLEALQFGAFGEGTEFQEIADELMRQRQVPWQNNLARTPAGEVPIKHLTAWFAVVDPISPDLFELRSSRGIVPNNQTFSMLFDTSAKEIGIVATAIENEARRIENLQVGESQPAATSDPAANQSTVTDAPQEADANKSNGKSRPTPRKKQNREKRRKGKGDLTSAQELIAAALREWHQFDRESLRKNSQNKTLHKMPFTERSLSCDVKTPISYRKINELLGKKRVSQQTISTFFNDWLNNGLEGGNDEYKRICSQDSPEALAWHIKKLSREGLLQINELLTDQIVDRKAKDPSDIDD